MRIAKYLLMPAVAAILALALGNPGVAAKGPPVADFPSFIPFDYGEFPEGIAVDKVGNVFASFRAFVFFPLDDLSDYILKITPSGAGAPIANFGTPGGGGCGLAVDAEGNVYMARLFGPNSGVLGGVYRVDREGNWVRLPGTEQIYPDGLAFDQRGTLYITEPFSLDSSYPGTCSEDARFHQGSIWRIPKGGTAELWLRSELLSGGCPNPSIPIPAPIGANGIQFYHGDLYVSVTDKNMIVRIPVNPDGSPGEISQWAQLSGGPDGLAMDVHGNVYAAIPGSFEVRRINADDQSQEIIASLFYPPPRFAPLDFPFSLAFGTGKGGRPCLFVTNGGWMKSLGGDAGSSFPGPSVVKIDVDIPGLPLP